MKPLLLLLLLCFSAGAYAQTSDMIPVCTGSLASVVDVTTGNYTPECSTEYQWEAYNPLLNATVDEGDANDLLSAILLVFVLAYSVRVIVGVIRGRR